jgi:F5/8 type C domain-containing protein
MTHHLSRGDAALSRLSRATALVALLACAGAALAAPINLAPLGIPTASSEGFGARVGYGNDGNRNGAFGGRSVFHTADPDTAAFYQVDLGNSYYLDRIQIFPRTDARQGSVENFRLSVMADDGAGNPGATVFSRDYLPTGNAGFTFGTTDPGTAAPGGTRGRFVRLDRLDGSPSFLTFAEFEVIGQDTPLPQNVALGRQVTASAPGFGARTDAGVDGDIDGDFYHAGFPVYHTAVAAPGLFYQVDLGGSVDLDYLELIDRGDADTTTQFRVAVIDAAGGEVFSTILDSTGLLEYEHTIDLTDVTGRLIRIETTRAEFLAFSEIRAFPVPEPTALAAVAALAIPALMRRRRA